MKRPLRSCPPPQRSTFSFSCPAIDKSLTKTLLKICAAGTQAFADEDVGPGAMGAVMSLATGLSEDVVLPEGVPLLVHLIALKLQCMLEVEQDVEARTKEGQEDDDDNFDDDVVGYAEENLDRLARELCAEEKGTFMTALVKVLRALVAVGYADWRHVRAAIMAIAKSVEYLEEEAWVTQAVEIIMQHLSHALPRVRYAAFLAI